MADKYYYIGPWVWQRDVGDGEYWRAPDNTIGLFDLRGADQEQGFFCTSVLILNSDYTLIGEGDLREYHTTLKQRDAWRSILSLKTEEMPDSITNLRDILIKTFEELGDPAGEKRFFSPTVTHLGNLEFFLGGHNSGREKNLISRRKFTGVDDPAWKNLQPLLQSTYQDYWDNEVEFRTKVLWNWVRKYKVLAKDLLPVGISEIAIKPETTVSDNFNRGNESLDAGNWTDVDGGFAIVGNEVRVDSDFTGFPAGSRYESDLSSDDHYAEIKQINLPSSNGGNTFGFWGPVIRFAAAADTYYFAVVREKDNEAHVRKKVAGTWSSVNIDTWTPHWPSVIGLQADGSTLKLFVDGGEESSFTDSSISGNLRCGLSSTTTGGMGTASGDDWSAADLATGGNPWWYYQRNKMRRSA